MNVCSVCGEPNHLDYDAHPCCVFWQRITPRRPCGSCAASRAYKRRDEPARLGYEPAPEGFVCSTCGLSDYGWARMNALGFVRRGCLDCREHFANPPAAELERWQQHLNPNKETRP